MIEETKYYKVLDGRLITDIFSLLIKDINSISFYQPLFAKVFSIFFGLLATLSSYFFIIFLLRNDTASIVVFFIVSTILILVTLYFSLFRRLTIESEHGKYSILSLSKKKKKSMKVLKDSLKF